MRFTAREGQKVIAGRVGSTKLVAEGRILQVNVKVGRSAEDWETVRLTDRRDGSPGNKSLFEKYGQVGQYVVFVCNETENGEFHNLWAVGMELGPKPPLKDETK